MDPLIYTGNLDVDTGWMGHTPGGHAYTMHVRPGTSDWNTVNACDYRNDEYHIPQGLTGWALDVGAHIGAATIPLLLDNPGLKVIAVEALPENVQLLKANAKRNDVCERLTVIQGAASDTSDQVLIGYGHDVQHEFIGGSLNAAGEDTSRKGIWCEGVTLTRVAALRGDESAQPFVWTKMDCEGCEYAFLASPAVVLLDFITGEVHRGWERLVAILMPTHFVSGDGKDFGAFMAKRHGR